MDAASSTPAGPAPTSTNVICRAGSLSSSVIAATSKARGIFARMVFRVAEAHEPGCKSRELTLKGRIDCAVGDADGRDLRQDYA
jgi:hypothetical protein